MTALRPGCTTGLPDREEIARALCRVLFERTDYDDILPGARATLEQAADAVLALLASRQPAPPVQVGASVRVTGELLHHLRMTAINLSTVVHHFEERGEPDRTSGLKANIAIIDEVVARHEAALAGATPDTPALERVSLTDAQIKHMVDRFLAWRLPSPFRPDNGISYTRPNYGPNVDATPQGTNLLDAVQAESMVRHLVEGLPDTLAVQDVVEAAFRAGWRVNASGPEEYLKGCENVDWVDYQDTGTVASRDVFDADTPAGLPREVEEAVAAEPLDKGIDFALEQLCTVLGVDPQAVSWDAATETFDGDVRAVIGNILTACYGDDWRAAAPPPPAPTAGEEPQGGDEHLARIHQAAETWIENHERQQREQTTEHTQRALEVASPPPEPDDMSRELAELSAKATPGEWYHYDEVFRRQFGHRRITEIQRRDGKAIVAWPGFDGLKPQLAKRRNHNARYIVALVNAHRSGRLAVIPAPKTQEQGETA